MKILLADDHWIVRESLKHVFEHIGVKLQALEAGSYLQAMDLLATEDNVGLVVVDLIMPGFDDFEGLHALRKNFPDIPVIVLSVQDGREAVMRCIELGVVGYVPKTASAEEMSRALERVLSGDVYFPRDILSRDTGMAKQSPESGVEEDILEILKVLTSREKEVLSWLGQGLTDTKIAEVLQLSPNTVRVHVKNIMKKLGLSDRPETMHFAVTNIGYLLSNTAR
ncbi:response regulator [Rhodobacteraceae bacterium Araon29]